MKNVLGTIAEEQARGWASAGLALDSVAAQVRDLPSTRLEHLLEFAEKHGGSLSITYDKEWSVAMHFGEETPGSEMWGGASYAMAPDLAAAIESVIEEIGADR